MVNNSNTQTHDKRGGYCMRYEVHTIEEHLEEMSKEVYHPGAINESLEMLEFKLIMRDRMMNNCSLSEREFLAYLEEMNFLSQEANNMRFAMYELGILKETKICREC